MSQTRRSLRNKEKKESKKQKEEKLDDSFVNNDTCEACSLEGDLICCDGCPCSFHGDCLEPPVTQEELGEKWFCNECRGSRGLLEKKENPLRSDSLSGIWDKLCSLNPKEFYVPSSMKRSVTIEVNKIPELQKYDVNQIHKNPDALKSRYLPSMLSGKKSSRKELENVCSVCSIAGDSLVSCNVCDKAYHITCLQPPLQTFPQGDWICPDHSPSDKNKTQTKIQDNTDNTGSLSRSLRPHLQYTHTTPTKDNKDNKESKVSHDNDIESKEDNIIKKKNEETNKQESLCNQAAYELENLFNQALGEREKLLLSNDSSAVLVITNLVNHLSQDFTRYLAWQRLSQFYVTLQKSSDIINTQKIPSLAQSNSSVGKEKRDSKTPTRKKKQSNKSENSKKGSDSENIDTKAKPQEETKKGKKRERESSKKSNEPKKKPKLTHKNSKINVENEQTPSKQDTAMVDVEVSPLATSNPQKNENTDTTQNTNTKTLPYFTLSAPEINVEMSHDNLSENFIIGRKNAEANLDLSQYVGAKTISHKHCYIQYNPETMHYQLHNLGRNGTRVNGNLCKDKVDLANGDTLELGKVVFTFKTFN